MVLFAAPNANSIEPIILNDQTPVTFYGNEATTEVLVDPLGQTNVSNILQRTPDFVSLNSVSEFSTRNYYWVHHKIKNEQLSSKTLTVNALFWNKANVFVFDENGKLQVEKQMGQIGLYNTLSTVNPEETAATINQSQFPLFTVRPGETVNVYLKLKSHPTWTETNILLPFSDALLQSEERRLSLFVEGGFIGILFALFCFAFFNALKTDDKTNNAYAAWLFSALAVLLCGWNIDGARFFELFVNIFGIDTNNHESLYMTFFNLTGYSQAIAYVVFARNFLEIKNHFPIFFKITNLYIFWYVSHFLFCLIFDHALPYQVVVYPLLLSTLLVLIGVYVVAYQRYRQGMKIAIYFMVAAVPYFLFRAIFLLSWVGIPSPFTLLPNHGLGLFFENSTAVMSLGICLEAIIMSLAVVGRMQFLQNELKDNALEKSQLIEEQKKGLEVVVAERTRELQSQNDQVRRQKNELEKISIQLRKYLPPQIHKSLLEGKYDSGITTRRKKLTIFFSDIKNFTSTTGGLQPEDLTKYLNEYFSEMALIAQKHGGTIDKYIGDAMMVFFGDPDSEGEREDARACVRMSLEMQDKIKDLQKKWRNEGFADPFEVRMGINTGYCNVGNFGSEQRLTYTVIGGEVNVAQRLEAAAEPNGILISYETYAHAQDLIDVEPKGAIQMKGINRDIKTFAILNRVVKNQQGAAPESEKSEDYLIKETNLDQAESIEDTSLSISNLISVMRKLELKVDQQEKEIQKLKNY